MFPIKYIMLSHNHSINQLQKWKKLGDVLQIYGPNKNGYFSCAFQVLSPSKKPPEIVLRCFTRRTEEELQAQAQAAQLAAAGGAQKGCVCVFFVFFTSPISFTSEVTQRTRTGVPLTFNSVPAVFTVFSRDSKGFGRFTRWWFQIFFIFTTTWGRFPIWLIFFRWVETTNQIHVQIYTYHLPTKNHMVPIKNQPFM